MENQEIDTLEKLVEIVGKRMRHYHNFRRELAALREAAQQGVQPTLPTACAACGSREFFMNEQRTCVQCKTPSR